MPNITQETKKTPRDLTKPKRPNKTQET
jgi:hypothetical protein